MLEEKKQAKKPAAKTVRVKEALAALEKAESYLEPFGHKGFSSGCDKVDKKGAEMLEACAELRKSLKK